MRAGALAAGSARQISGRRIKRDEEPEGRREEQFSRCTLLVRARSFHLVAPPQSSTAGGLGWMLTGAAAASGGLLPPPAPECSAAATAAAPPPCG